MWCPLCPPILFTIPFSSDFFRNSFAADILTPVCRASSWTVSTLACSMTFNASLSFNVTVIFDFEGTLAPWSFFPFLPPDFQIDIYEDPNIPKDTEPYNDAMREIFGSYMDDFVEQLNKDEEDEFFIQLEREE